MRDNRAEDIITRILTIKQYVDRAKVKVDDGYKLTTKELCAISKFTQQDLFGAIALAFTYGQTKGYRAAKGLPPNLQNKQKATSSKAAEVLDAEILELAKSLDPVQLCAAMATAKELAAGTDPVAALAAGNIVLASAGYPPAPVYVPESGCAGEGAEA